MINIMSNLYLGREAEKNIEEFRGYLRENKFPLDWYAVTVSNFPDASIELTPFVIFRQAHFVKKTVDIYGLAKGKPEGMAVMTRMVLDCYHHTGGFDVVSYLKGRCGS